MGAEIKDTTERQEKYPNLVKQLKKGEKLPGCGRPKGVKAWRTVFRDLFTMSPEEVEKQTGIKLPEKYTKIDIQYAVGMVMISRALKGDITAFDKVADRMDGRPKEFIETVNQNVGILIDDIESDCLKEKLLKEQLKEIEKNKNKKA